MNLLIETKGARIMKIKISDEGYTVLMGKQPSRRKYHGGRGMRAAIILLAAVLLGAAWFGCGREAEPPEVKTGFLDIGTAKIYYEEAGKGRPIVMVHGGLLNASMWDDQFEVFARDYRVIRYDARGHGRSASEPDTFSHHEDLRELIEALKLEKPVVMGLSMGGYTAIDFALEYPDQVGALVLVAPGLSGYEFRSEEFFEFSKRIGEAAQSEDIDAVVEAFLSAWTDGPRREPGEIDPAIRERARAMVKENVERWDDRSAEYRPLPLAIERLDSLRVPVLALVGDLDMPGILEIVELIETEVPGARKVMVADVAHLINMEKPAEFNRTVLQFLGELPR